MLSDFKDWCKKSPTELIGFILLGILMIGALVGLFIMVNDIEPSPYRFVGYEYTDSLGRTGMSDHCYMSSGHLICYTDKGRISVIEYREVYEKNN